MTTKIYVLKQRKILKLLTSTHVLVFFGAYYFNLFRIRNIIGA